VERLADNLEFLTKLELVGAVAQRFFGGQLLGQRRSRRFGSGLEYADFRAYAPGDDVRRLYWQAYLLHRRLVCKVFEESSELVVYLLVDRSLSMARGQPSKLLYAKKIAAALGYVALSGLDQVVMVPFSSEAHELPAPMAGRGRLGDLLRRLDDVEAAGATDLERTARQLCQRYTRRGLCVLLSDFFDARGYGAAIKLLHHHQFIVTSIVINEREELEPSLRGDAQLEDCESGAAIDVQLTPALLASYRHEVRRHYAELAHLTRAFGYQQAEAETAQPFHDFLLALFRRGILVR
jgi:uncharacterized protein (DUF58 family)